MVREPGVVIEMPKGPQREARVAQAVLKRREPHGPSVVIPLPERPLRDRDYILDPGDPVEAIALIMSLKQPAPAASPLAATAPTDPRMFVRSDVRARAHEVDTKTRRPPALEKAAAAPGRDKPKAPKK